jgi:hypothetical protein
MMEINLKPEEPNWGYVCSETGIGGLDLENLAATEVRLELGVEKADAVGDFVNHMTKSYGDKFGSDYDAMKDSLLGHIAKHAECSELYENLKNQYRVLWSSDEDEMDRAEGNGR